MGWQWHQPNHMQAICTSLQKIATPAPHQSDFYGPDALPDTQPTASKHWRHSCFYYSDIIHSVNAKALTDIRLFSTLLGSFASFLIMSECHSILHKLKLEKTALDRGRTDHISLTHDLDLDLVIPCELWSWPTHMQKFKVNGQSVPKTEWQQMDGQKRLHYLTIMGRYAVKHHMISENLQLLRGTLLNQTTITWNKVCYA